MPVTPPLVIAPAATQAAAPDDIHHGADDNASGATAVLLLADHFAHAGPQARTLIFVTFTAEEEGLIGSAWFVAHPPAPMNKIAAMLNLDMVGRVHDESIAVGGTGTAPSLEKIVTDADQGLALKLTPNGIMTGGKGGIGPSDHMSFAMKKVPVLFFFSGMHMDYHRPTDTADKVNFEGLNQVVELSDRVVEALAKMPREAYVATYDVGGRGGGGGGGHNATLGLIPSYGDASPSPGVKISGTVEGSPASRAGLQGGDVIIKWNSDKTETLEGLSDLLAKAKPGDKVHLVVLRDGKDIEFDAVLAERKAPRD